MKPRPPRTEAHVLKLRFEPIAQAVTRLFAWVKPRQSLHDLDDHALRDIGVQRSEIASIEAESRGCWAQATRLRIVARHPV